MNVLVIGGSGFLSSAIVREALSRGHEVTTVTRGNAGRAVVEGTRAVFADRSDPVALRSAVAGLEFDLVIDSILFKPEDALAAVDIFGGRVQRYVFISTDFVYGGEPRRFPLDESTPCRATTLYGIGKAAAEDVLFQSFADSGFPAVVLRPPHILGAGSLLGTGSREGRDAWLLWRLRNGHPIWLLDGGTLIIQPVHKDDIARACFAVAESSETLGRAYNISGPDAVSTRRYYEMVCELIGIGSDSLKVAPLPSAAYLAAWPDRIPFAQNRCYSLERLRADTGYAPPTSLRAALADTIAALEAKGYPEGEPPVADVANFDNLNRYTTENRGVAGSRERVIYLVTDDLAAFAAAGRDDWNLFAGGTVLAESLTRGVTLLESKGYRVRVAPHTSSVDPERAYLGGTDDERVSDLNALLRDPEIDLILCSRGGYGCARLLDRVDYAAILADPKPLVGYSDITALNLALAAKTGVVSFSGPMASGGDSFGDENFDSWTGERFFQMLDKSGPELRTLPHADGFAPWEIYRGPTMVTGPVVPVCFTLLTSLHGTPYVPDLAGAILVMEDVHEDLYAIDRCLTQLRLSGVLDKLAGVVIGSFNGVDEEETAKLAAGVPRLVLQMTPEHVAVASGVAYGHINRRLTLPMGAAGTVDLTAGTFTFDVPLP